MPRPKAGEEKDAYISRCVSQLIKDEGKEQKQALAICFSMWERRDEDTSIDGTMEKYLTEHFYSQKGPGHKWPMPDKRIGMKCMECGKKFKSSCKGEPKCPRCKSTDVEPD